MLLGEQEVELRSQIFWNNFQAQQSSIYWNCSMNYNNFRSSDLISVMSFWNINILCLCRCQIYFLQLSCSSPKKNTKALRFGTMCPLSYGKQQWTAVFPQHWVQDCAFWIETSWLEGQRGGPLAHPQANQCSCEKPQRALCDAGGQLWRDPLTQSLPLFIYIQSKHKSLV